MTKSSRKKARYPLPLIKRAHKASFLNEAAIKTSVEAGCFCCCKVYPASQVTRWITERSGGKTARCPCCDIDSVIGDSSGYAFTKGFLSAMEKHWFDQD